MSAEALVIANYLRVASQDLDGARTLAASGNRNAVYLCEQAAEKIIRAVLTSEGTHGGIKHQLDLMVDEVPDANPMKAQLRAIEHLAAFATTYRYPTAAGRVIDAPLPADLAADIKKVEVALAEAVRGFEVDLAAGAKTPAKRPVPLR